MSILDKISTLKSILNVFDKVITVLVKCLDVILDKGVTDDITIS